MGMIDWIFISIIWITFLSLLTYVVMAERFEKLNSATNLIRKIWYLIFLLGVVIALTNDKTTLFYDWEKYLIALIVFLIVDALLFLELYVSKFGGQELKSVKTQIGVTQEELDLVDRKVSHLTETLTTFAFVGYTYDKKEYIEELNKLLDIYGFYENLTIDVFDLGSADKEDLFKSLGDNTRSIKRTLSNGDAVPLDDDTKVLYPFAILNSSYVIRAMVKDDTDKVIKTDGNIIATLVITFNLAVKLESKQEDERR